MVESIQYFDEPEVVVEIAWNDNYAEPFPTWTDISDRVQGFDTRLGRSTEIGEVEAGVTNLIVDNSDGAFTPGNPNSPFYPNVKPRRQVRVRVPSVFSGDEQTVTLTNDVRNPFFRGDSVGCGFEISPSQVLNFASGSDPNNHPGYANIGYQKPSMSMIAHNGPTDAVKVPFPCVAGDYVSAAAGFYPAPYYALNPNPPQPTGALTLSFIDANGGVISQVDNTQSIPFTAEGTTLTLENIKAPVNTVGYYVASSLSNVDVAVFGYLSGMSSYNHGQQAYTWPDGVAFMCEGSKRSDSSYAYAWEGTPHNSRTIVRTLPNTEGVLGRGYIQNWPTTFSGLTSEVTVPVTDWLSAFGSNPLSHPMRYEYDLRTPADLFTFGEGDEARSFYSAVNPDVKADSLPSYPPGAPIYSAANLPVPYIGGGNGTLSEGGLPGDGSVKPQDQNTYTDANSRKFYLGASISVPIPEIVCSRDSFSFMFLYELYNTFSDLEPWAFILRDSRYDPGHGSEIMFYTDSTGSALTVVRRASDDRPALAYDGVMKGAPRLAGFSWDHVNKQVRSAFGTTGTSVFAETGAEFSWDTWGSGSNTTVGTWLSDARFDTLQVLGYSDAKTLNGFADHAMQFLGRWDHALTTADMEAIRDCQDGFPGQTTDQRLHYILDQAGWPNELRRIESSETTCSRVNWDTGTDALSYLKSTASDALGTMLADQAGYVTFLDRTSRVLADVSWTFDHDAGTGIESGLTFNMSEDDIINVAQVTNSFGVDTTIVNQPSVDEFGVKSESYEVRLGTDTQAIQYGYHMVNRYGDARVRVDAVTFNPSAHAYGDLWDVALGVRVGQRVRLSGLPSTAPADSMDFFVESVAHDVTRDGERLKWSVTLNLSPTDVWDAWVLGDSTKGVLGTTTKLIF